MSYFPDTNKFIDLVARNKDFLAGVEPIIITRAPGRLDVMGGIADYSGSLVLQLPIADATHVALQKTSSSQFHIRSLGNSAPDRDIEIELSVFMENGAPTSYSAARTHFSNAQNHWAAYVAGAFLVLMQEKNYNFKNGARILISSEVPEGKGVSSSAAIEVATLQAVNVAYNLQLAPQEVARLCQKVENHIAGAPCGIMDQMTSACGEENRLLELLCQPGILQGTLALPDELEVWGIDSGVRHSVRGSDYGTVRTAAFMGYRIIAELAGLPVSANDPGRVQINDSRWNGYLANISVEEFETVYAVHLPEALTGGDFLERYQGITDHVTTVRPDVTYPVLKATQHPVFENARVHRFASTLKKWHGIDEVQTLGELMFESHQSYSDCGLGSEATDLIAALVRESRSEGLFGARITGGGSGGTVAVLGQRGAADAIEKLRVSFQEKTGHYPLVISGSSPGAGIFDHVKIESAAANKN